MFNSAATTPICHTLCEVNSLVNRSSLCPPSWSLTPRVMRNYSVGGTQWMTINLHNSPHFNGHMNEKILAYSLKSIFHCCIISAMGWNPYISKFWDICPEYLSMLITNSCPPCLVVRTSPSLVVISIIAYMMEYSCLFSSWHLPRLVEISSAPLLRQLTVIKNKSSWRSLALFSCNS